MKVVRVELRTIQFQYCRSYYHKNDYVRLSKILYQFLFSFSTKSESIENV
jgi:hypothetical protein